MYVHGDNLSQKESDDRKYNDTLSKQYLAEIRPMYDAWRRANDELAGPGKRASPNDAEIITKRVKLLNEYKDFLDQQKYAEHFDSRSNLHSSVLEEFMYYLFRDLAKEFSRDALIGKSHAFKDLFFRGSNYPEMLTSPCAFIEEKDHDFVIGASIDAKFKCRSGEKIENACFEIPAVAIECKTYLDKTMLEGASNAGAQLKDRNPNAVYIVVAERLKLTEAVNLKKYKVDQIYVLRKQKNTDREFRYDPNYVANPIYADVVFHLFNYVRSFLLADWRGSVADGLQRGYLI